jgi:hypothetical protein
LPDPEGEPLLANPSRPFHEETARQSVPSDRVSQTALESLVAVKWNYRHERNMRPRNEARKPSRPVKSGRVDFVPRLVD